MTAVPVRKTMSSTAVSNEMLAGHAAVTVMLAAVAMAAVAIESSWRSMRRGTQQQGRDNDKECDEMGAHCGQRRCEAHLPLAWR